MSGTYDAIVDRYMERTKRSRELHSEAKRLLPRGVSSNFRVVDPNPIFIESAVGTTITDADGNRYTDFSNAFGAMLVGHAHPKVVDAIAAQAKRGTLHAMPHRLEISVAKELREDRKSTRLNSSHGYISYAVFCLKKKKNYLHAPEWWHTRHGH